jgi:hypothetical protein
MNELLNVIELIFMFIFVISLFSVLEAVFELPYPLNGWILKSLSSALNDPFSLLILQNPFLDSRNSINEPFLNT